MPRRDWLLDSAGNRVLVNGDAAFADGAQAVRQGIECRVRLWFGEYWLNTGLGVRYLELVLARGSTPAAIKAEIAAAIADTPDVTRVAAVSYSADPATRTGHVSYTVSTPEAPNGALSGTL